MSNFKAFFSITLLSAILYGCGWPFYSSSDNNYEPFDPEPVSLDSVQTSDIRLSVNTALFEDEDSLEVLANLRTAEYEPLLLGLDATLELHVLTDQGAYQPVEVSEYEALDAGARFKVPSPIAPVSYRLLLNRSNTEIVELFNFELRAKVSSESTAINTTYGNGDSFEFTWMSYDSNGRLDTVPPGWIRYRLECGNPFVSRETVGSRVIISSVDLSEDNGLDTEPTIFDVDTVLSEHAITNFPCELYLERVFYVYKESNNYFLFSGSFGSEIGTADYPGNSYGFSAYAKIYTITVEGN
jgi:hypothetical protein